MPEEHPISVPIIRANAIIKRVTAPFKAMTYRLLSIYPHCRLPADVVLGDGLNAAVEAVDTLPPALLDVVRFQVLEAIGKSVGATAILEVVNADLQDRPRKIPQDRMPDLRASRITYPLRYRLMVGAHMLLKANRACALPPKQLCQAGEDAAQRALLDLPAAVVNVAGDMDLHHISYYVAWTAMFDLIEADRRSRPQAGVVG